MTFSDILSLCLSELIFKFASKNIMTLIMSFVATMITKKKAISLKTF